MCPKAVAAICSLLLLAVQPSFVPGERGERSAAEGSHFWVKRLPGATLNLGSKAARCKTDPDLSTCSWEVKRRPL